MSVVNAHLNELPVKFYDVSMKAKTNFIRCIGYLSFTKDRTKVKQVGNDQEMSQSERNSHSKNRGGKN